MTMVGMGAKIRNYYRKASVTDNTKVAFVDGTTITMQKDDKSPFIADIPLGTAIQSFENNCFKVPIFKHKPKTSDFLIIRTYKNDVPPDEFKIREIPALFTAGQIFPLREVPAPNSNPARNFMKGRLLAYAWRFFKDKSENGSNPTLKRKDINGAFPGQSDASIRKILREIAEYKNGSWHLKPQLTIPSDEDIESKISPDDVALYECMLAGSRELQSIGIEGLHNVTVPLLSNIDKIPDASRLRPAAKRIEEELRLTPWNLTSNFIQAVEGKSPLQLSGFGDPSNRGEAFSFVKLSTKGPSRKSIEDANKASVTGTDADLRKLTLEQAKDLLVDFGVPADQIDNMSRWDRIDKIREISSDRKADGKYTPLVEKYARENSKKNVAQHQEAYDKKLQRIFENMIYALSTEEPEISSEESSEDEERLKELEELEAEFMNDEDFMNIPKKNSNRGKINQNFERARMESDLDEDMAFKDLKSVISEPGSVAPKRKETTSTYTINDDRKENGPSIGQKYYIIRRISSGSEAPTRIDIITDAQDVHSILSKQQKQGKKRFRLPPTGDEAKKRVDERKEKRRLQERIRREKKIEKWQKILQARYRDGSEDGSLPGGGNVLLQCGRCKMYGHMKTNKSCPLYVDPEVEEAMIKNKPTVQIQEGTRIMISKSVIKNKAKDTRPKSKRQTRDRHPGVFLNNIFGSILKKLLRSNFSDAFKNPVNERVAPNYYSVIEKPIDLSKIQEKIKNNEYFSRLQFDEDLNLMRDNCYKYNTTAYHPLRNAVDELLAIAGDELDKNSAELRKFEAQIQGSTYRNKRKLDKISVV
eukprot:TRINITY_DN4211_c0_g3_i1.p1 TRINITY_DN4211_c0_g3~~TRINITY_DN4211_c0_g3_i1.p1  ORF type:complete len:854 (+),score=220.47 TRINITY_DN4211_c0_g3_i1:115-2562(+)